MAMEAYSLPSFMEMDFVYEEKKSMRNGVHII